MSPMRRSRRALVLLGPMLAISIVAFPLVVIASHQFSDVPTTSGFHADIDAIAAAGVTAGCGPGKYCPKDFVTREQMAAFLNRLGALGPGKTPVVDADRLDGLDGSAYAQATHDHDGDYLGTGAKAADAERLDGLDGSAYAQATHDHDGDYLGTGAKAADADLLDGADGSSYTRGIKAVRLGSQIDLTTSPTTVATLALPVSTSHYTFFVFFTAEVVTSGGLVQCDLVRDDDVIIHSRRAGQYSPYSAIQDLSLNYPVWIGDTPNVRVDCRKLEPTMSIAAVGFRELQALALGSGP